MNLMIDHGPFLPPRRTALQEAKMNFWPLDEESIVMDDHD